MKEDSNPPKTITSIAEALQSLQREGVQSQPIHVPLPPGMKDDKLAIIVPGVLSEDECERIIRSCEAHGFEEALLNIGCGKQVLVTNVRKSLRCVIDDVKAADILWERMHQAAPYTIMHGGMSWQCVGLNERMRVLKYEPGDYYVSHSDGTFVRPAGACTATGEPGDTSFFTVMFYLNTPVKGGGTNLISSTDSKQVSHVKPCTGQALIFDHSIRYEAATLESGVKYAIRTDVIYRCLGSTKPAKDTATSVFLPTKRAPHGYMMKC